MPLAYETVDTINYSSFVVKLYKIQSSLIQRNHSFIVIFFNWNQASNAVLQSAPDDNQL